MKITANFSESEFLPATIGSYESLSQRSKYMAAALACTLEIIRAAAREKTPKATIHLNSGVRTPEHNKKIGGSQNSDHLFGFASASIGAADIVCPEMNMTEFFNLCISLKYSGRIKTGQLLFEKNKSFWVHIANDPALFLTSAQMKARTEFSLYGVAWNFQNGKSGCWHEITKGKFFKE
jgi:hypothetical protein